MTQQPQPERYEPLNGEKTRGDTNKGQETPPFSATEAPRMRIEQLLSHIDPGDTINEDTARHIEAERAAGRLKASKSVDAHLEKKKRHEIVLEKMKPFKNTPIVIKTRDELHEYFQEEKKKSNELLHFDREVLPQFLMAFHGWENVLPKLKKQKAELTQTIEEDSRRLQAIPEGAEMKKEEAIESLQQGISAQIELKSVQEKIDLVERKLLALQHFTASILEAIKTPSLCEQLDGLLMKDSAEDLIDIALLFVEKPEKNTPPVLQKNTIPEPINIDDRERKILITILQEYALVAPENDLSDFQPQELDFPETSGEFAIVSRIRFRLGKNELSKEESVSMVKLLRAFLECFKKKDIKDRIVKSFRNTAAPALLRLAARIVTDRANVNTGTYYRLRLEEEGHIPQTVKLGLKALKELRKKIREDETISENNRQAILMILFYALHLMKPIAGRIPRDESTTKHRKAVARANRALTPLKEIVGAVEGLYEKAAKAAKAERNEIIMVPDTVTIQFSLLRAIREDISFSQKNETEDIEQIIEGTQHLGITNDFDKEALETLKQIFQAAFENFPEHKISSNISAEELIGFMLESNHDRNRPVYQQWVLQVLTRAASNMFPITSQKLLKPLLNTSAGQAGLPAEMKQRSTSPEDLKLLQRIQDRLEEIERMGRQPENQKNPAFSVEKAYSFATGIMAMILFIPAAQRERCGFSKHFNYLIQIIENAARKTDTFFDDSLVKEMLDQMENYSATGKKSGVESEEEMDSEVAEFFDLGQ